MRVTGLREKLSESSAAMRRVFRNPGLRRVNLAFAGSVVGDWAFAIVISLYAYNKGGATALGVVGVVRYLTMAVLAPLLSTLADRYRRKYVMLGADLVRAALVGIVALLVATDGPALAVYALATATVVLGSAFRPASAALLPALARDASELTAANVASSTIESVGFFAGPALAGLLLAFANSQTVILLDAFSFLWSAALIVGLHVADELPKPEKESQSFVAEVTQGFRTIHADNDLRLLMALFFAQTVIAGASLVFQVAVALRLLHLGQSGVGYLGAMMGIGGIIGGFAALMLAARKRMSIDFGLGVMLWAAPLVVLAAWPTLAAAIGAMVLIGVGNSLVDVNAFTILQRIVPDEVMGRVFGAVESVLVAGMALGALLMPLLIATVGLRGGLAIIGVSVTGLVIAGIAGLNRIDTTTLAPAQLPLVMANDILAPLPDGVQERLARALIEMHVAAGGVVCHEGDAGDRYYLIASGTAEVSAAGKTVNMLGPGDAFGEIALLRDIPRQATVRAIDDLTLYALERDVFLAAVTGHGEASTRAENTIARFLAV
jgi:MFS family permease